MRSIINFQCKKALQGFLAIPKRLRKKDLFIIWLKRLCFHQSDESSCIEHCLHDSNTQTTQCTMHKLNSITS